MSSDETQKNFEIIRNDFKKQFDLLGISEDVSKYTHTLTLSEIYELVQVWNDMIEEAERKNRAINMVTLIDYIGAPRKRFYDQTAIQTDSDKENKYRNIVSEILKFLNKNFGEQLFLEFSEDLELNEILKNENIFNMGNVSIKPELFRKILTKLEKLKQNSEYSGDSTWLSILKEKNLISTDFEPANQISEILKKYKKRQITLAFNPSNIYHNSKNLDLPETEKENDEDDEVSEISDFEKMELEPTSEEKLISIKILAEYYGIELPTSLNDIELADKYYCYKAAWTIERKNNLGQIKENFSDYLVEEEEDLVTTIPDELLEDEDEDIFLMNELIAHKKFEFYSENLKTFLKEILGFDYNNELQKCEQKGLSKEKCIKSLDNYLKNIFRYMNKLFESSDFEWQEYYIKSYTNSLPLSYSLKYIPREFVDENILDLNPIEFQLVLKAMKELSEVMGIDLAKDGSGWRKAFKTSLNENS